MPTAPTLFTPTRLTDPTARFAPRANSTPKHPGKYFYADQYSNDANWQAHYHGTANEIWQQTEGRVTHFVSMMGTSGTFVGTTRRLKELNPAIRCISLQPDSPFHGIEGAKHMASAIVPKIYDATLADEDIGISTEDAYSMAKRLAREEGLLVGISAAAAVVGCLQVARKLGKGEQRGVRDDPVRFRRQVFEREILGRRLGEFHDTENWIQIEGRSGEAILDFSICVSVGN